MQFWIFISVSILREHLAHVEMQYSAKISAEHSSETFRESSS